MHRPDTPGTVSGAFVSGDPYASPPRGGAVLGHDWLNDLGENIYRVAEANGVVLEKGNYDQLRQAIGLMIAAGPAARRESRAQARARSTTLDLFGFAVTTAGNLTDQRLPNGPVVRATTINHLTTVPEDIGFRTTTYDFIQRRWDPDVAFEARVAVKTHARAWIALTSADPMALADPATLSLVGFRYDDPTDSATGTVKFVGSDGTSSVVKETGIAFPDASDLRFRIRHAGLGLFQGFVDDALVATIDGTTAGGEPVPAGTTELGWVAMLRHLSDVAAKSIDLRLVLARQR